MKKNLVILFLASCSLLCLSGCMITTAGSGSWEVYSGVRTTQHSEQPAKVEIESSLVDKLLDPFADGKVSPDD